MRIALVNTFIPYIYGGAEIVVNDLMDQLRQVGHEVVLFRIPFPKSYEAELIATIESTRMLDFDEFDRVITFKFPAYCIKHNAKVIWLFHQFRQVYELWGGEYGLKPDPTSYSIRKIVKEADDIDIPSSLHIFTNSIEVSKRLKRFNNIESDVLMPPLKNPEHYYCNDVGDYIYYPSRITNLKRQHLAIEAMRYVNSDVRLVISGVCKEDIYLDQLKKIIREYNLEKRVELHNYWISDEEKQQLFANALGGIYIPFLEDSCGFVSMESFYSAKPVITCTDSGGTKELVEDKVTGFNVEPTPQAIAQAMDKLYDDKILAEKMGRTALDEILRRDITWPSTIKRLLS